MGRFSLGPYFSTSVPPLGLRSSQSGLRPEGQTASSACSEAYLAGSKACLAGSWALEGGGRTDVRTDGKSPRSTGLCPLLGPLHCFPSRKLRKSHSKIKAEQGKGTADHLMTLRDCFIPKYALSHHQTCPFPTQNSPISMVKSA